MGIYLDHAATTPVYPEVVDLMLPYLQQVYGNPSSTHRLGRQTKGEIERARTIVAHSFGATGRQLVFTSGGTEADNLALIGAAFANRERGNHIITTSVEHHAVLHTCQYLQEQGFEVTYLPVDETGRIRLEDLKAAIKETTILISMMYGNNEVGVLQPIAEVAELAKETGVLVHTDAVQAFGVEQIDVNTLPVDLLSVSGHKIGGPKGIGALYIRENVKFSAQLHGGAQERQRRAGTENVPGIVGFAKAVQLAQQSLTERREKYLAIRNVMLETWQLEGVEYEVNGHRQAFLPHVLNVSFPKVDTEIMLMNLDLEGVFCSSGSACSAGSLEVSHVLQAMRLSEDRLRSAVRFSFGWNNTIEEGRVAAQKTAAIIKRLTDR
ncbi:cysteine desulfurase NifS [Ammoniphilus oxalaticus]|uniref:cysteine desulfurase n=1 Tax=Ammoniphilus oxalaticus TaxID=66863 RepID=A0A419SIZ5_9BACL|nr:cysteine desulfurase NifS [Ammoniphilus oxalaticus]